MDNLFLLISINIKGINFNYKPIRKIIGDGCILLDMRIIRILDLTLILKIIITPYCINFDFYSYYVNKWIFFMKISFLVRRYFMIIIGYEDNFLFGLKRIRLFLESSNKSSMFNKKLIKKV